MATAKGFAAAAQKKLLGVSTLDALAAMCVAGENICVVLDARKKQVYTAMYGCGDDGRLTRKGEIRVLSPERLIDSIHEPVVLVGDGVLTYRELFREHLEGRVRFAPDQLHAPSAAAVGLLCGGLLAENSYLDIASASPLYVRASDAELSLADKKQNASRDLKKA
jgi:tRNA threonylcarbamoyladenosine biosynthesis protein TsaB